MINPLAYQAQPTPPRTFAEDFGWQERFVPEAAAIIGQVLLRPAPIYLDRNKNVDIVLQFDAFTGVSMRMRRFPHLGLHPNDITIRAARPSGASTEVDKLDTCLTSHMFYGFSNEREDGIAAWTLLDLIQLRRWWAQVKDATGREPGKRIPNLDGTEFIVIALTSLPPDVIIDRQRFGDAAW